MTPDSLTAPRPKTASLKIRSVLFACNMNSIRSPMAEALAKKLFGRQVRVASCGIYEGEPDPFIPGILAEEGIELGEAVASQTFEALDVDDFDLVVALTARAAEAAAEYTSVDKIELWQTPNPTDTYGGRDQIMAAYREALNVIKERLIARFSVK